jgi:hypothetical protein
MFLSIASFMMFVSILVRNTKASIGIGFLLPLALVIFDKLCKIVDKLKDLPKYLPDRLMSVVASPNPAPEDIIIAFVVGIGIIIVTTILGMYYFEKKDIITEMS